MNKNFKDINDDINDKIFNKNLNIIEQIKTKDDFKKHLKSKILPLSKIKKIMKSDEEVEAVSQNAPIIFAELCELFIKELTIRSWEITKENNRNTLTRNDITTCITNTDTYDYLIDILPAEEY